RKDKKNSILLNPDTKFDPAYVQYTGDEPFMLFSSLNIPIAVSSSRINAIKKLCEENKVDIIISDDGYQNFSFYKDISILIINLYEISRKPQILFPLGNLREKLSSALKRTQYVILNHSRYVDYITVSKIMHKIKQINRDIKIIKSYYKIKNFVHLYTQKIYLPNEFLLMNFNIMVSCGLGKPELFIRSLELIGLEVKHKFFYPDHYWYKTQDLKRWRKFGNYPVVVTYKDAVKLFPLINKLEKMYIDKIYYCNVELEIEEGKDIWEELIHSLSSS
ncbi:MAG: tetraacyldisaccharide 4'-kinase, partial [Endomicrobia bacterium]|nr:tetraacyldisaccharide 4'-kinase [Endomicrobiia bacterium]